MHLTDEQEFVLRKILKNFQDHLRLYGDDESEELMAWLSSSMVVSEPKPKDPVRFVMKFTDRNCANIANDYFRSDRFMKVTKDEVIVEMVTTKKLSYADSARLRSIFEEAGLHDEYGHDDLDAAVLAARSMLWSGGTLVSITPDAP